MSGDLYMDAPFLYPKKESTVQSQGTMGLEAAMTIVRLEVENAQRKHPVWAPGGITHAAAIVAEEAGELVREALHLEHEGCGDEKKYLDEAIQTAAVAIRLLMNK